MAQHDLTPQFHHVLALLFILILISGCSSVPRAFSPTQPLSIQEFSHQPFNAVLQAHVSEGVVKYPQLAEDPRFSEYVEQLNHIDPTAFLTRNEQLAFWINAYNAFAIKGILDGYSPRTKIGQWRFFIGQTYAVGGEPINLYDLEQAILIHDFHEPRIHFAIVCASQSCPHLRSWAYDPAHLDEQLNDSARRFINDVSKNRFDRSERVAYLSRIFDWFAEDFEAQAGSLANYVSQFVNDPELAQDLRIGNYSIEFLNYDWNLNGIPPMLP